jgi:hypothetical protein
MNSILRLLGASLLLLASCGPLNFSSQEVSCSYNADDDSLKVKLVYNEVWHVDKTSGWFQQNPEEGEPDLERGEKAVRRMLNGDRIFMLLGNLLNYDLDDIEPEKQTEFQRGVSAKPALVELDAKGRLRIKQEFVFPNLSQGMKLGNEELRREVAQEVEEQLAKPDPDGFDLATLKLIKADIDAGRDWIRWNADGLHLTFPASPELLAKIALDGIGALAACPDEEIKDLVPGFRGLSQLTKSLSALTVQDNRLHLTFGPKEGGWVIFNFLEQWEYQTPEEADQYDRLLLEHLQSEGLVPEPKQANSQKTSSFR